MIDEMKRWLRYRALIPSKSARIASDMFWESHHRWWTEQDMRPTGETVELPVPRSRHTVLVRPGTCDPIVYYDCLIDGQYTKALRREKNIRTIVDAGANVGMASVAFLVRFPDARLLAIECDPENAECLRTNTKAFANRVTVIEGALVKDHRSPVSLNARNRGTWAASVEYSPDGTLESVTPEECIGFFGESLDVFKIDIEGGELGLLGGSPDWLSCVRHLLIEPENDRSRDAVRGAAAAHRLAPAYHYRDVYGYARH